MTLWWQLVPAIAWQAALLAAVVWMVVRAGRRWPAPFRQGLLLLALVKFLIPPFVTSPFSVSALVASPPQQTAVHRAAAPEGPVVPPWWLTTAPLAHAAGTLLLVAAIAAGQVRLVRVRRRSRLVSGGPLAAQCGAIADRIGLRRRPIVLLSHEVDSPMACGLRRPAVLLPAALPAALSTEELAAVLAHEVGHHRRRDVHLAALRAVVCALWWWHPLAWMLARALRNVQEDGCDDLVL